VAVAMTGLGLVLAAPGLGGGMSWDFSVRSRLSQLAFSNALVSVSPIAIVAGATWAALLLLGARRFECDWRCRAGFLLLAGSIFVPASVGSGDFLFDRLHILGLIILAPLMVRTITGLPRLATATLSLLMAGALLGVFVVWTEAGRQLDEDRRRITALLEAAGVDRGAAVTFVFPRDEMRLYRAGVYAHLIDRSALDTGAVVADNYQANYTVFPVSWVDQRTAVTPRQKGQEWDVGGPIETALYVVHLADARPSTLGLVTLVDDDRFAVTRLDPDESAPPRSAWTDEDS
jgi:hypothetical protein